MREEDRLHAIIRMLPSWRININRKIDVVATKSVAATENLWLGKCGTEGLVWPRDGAPGQPKIDWHDQGEPQ